MGKVKDMLKTPEEYLELAGQCLSGYELHTKAGRLQAATDSINHFHYAMEKSHAATKQSLLDKYQQAQGKIKARTIVDEASTMPCESLFFREKNLATKVALLKRWQKSKKNPFLKGKTSI